MKFRKLKSLKNLNTFHVEAVAKYYCEVSDLNEICEAIAFSKKNKVPIFVLGGGANILFTKDINALVVKIKVKGIKIIDQNDDFVTVSVGAGEKWDDFVRYSTDNGWGGIENLALIPGTVGAAAIQNIAAYGQNFAEVFECLEAVNLKDCSIHTFNKDECKFVYRGSIFKERYRNKYIVTNVVVRLAKNPVLNTSYFETGKTYKKGISLASELGGPAKLSPTVKDVYNAVVRIRRKNLPNPSRVGTAGSFFKNPVVKRSVYEKLANIDPLLQCYPVEGLQYYKLDDPHLSMESYVKLPAGRLVDFMGWKGIRKGKVGTYKNQALAVVSYGASGREILKFAREIQRMVAKKYKIKLDPEVVIV